MDGFKSTRKDGKWGLAMKNILLRKVSDDLWFELKCEAPTMGMGMEEYCTHIIKNRPSPGKEKPAPLLPPAKTDAGQELVATFRRHGKLKTDAVGTAGAKVTVAIPEAESKPITNLLGIGGVAVGSDPRYARPAHAPGCKCFSCCPPKGEK